MEQKAQLLTEEQFARLRRIQLDILTQVVKICDKYQLQYCLVGGSLLGAIRHHGYIPWDDDLDIGMPRHDYEVFLTLCAHELGDDFQLDCFATNPRYWQPFAKVRKRGTIYETESQVGVHDIPKGVWIDIFPFDNTRWTGILQRLQGFAIKILRIGIYEKQIGRGSTLKRYPICAIFAGTSVGRLFSLLHSIMNVWNDSECTHVCFFAGVHNVSKETHAKRDIFPMRDAEFEGRAFRVPNKPHNILTTLYGNYMELPPKEERVGHAPSQIDLGS